MSNATIFRIGDDLCQYWLAVTADEVLASRPDETLTDLVDRIGAEEFEVDETPRAISEIMGQIFEIQIGGQQ